MVKRAAIRKLRLNPGDVLVVRDPLDALTLQQTRSNLDFPVQIVTIRESVHRLSKEYLLKLLGNAK